jgi:hypothetical protein
MRLIFIMLALAAVNASVGIYNVIHDGNAIFVFTSGIATGFCAFAPLVIVK